MRQRKEDVRAKGPVAAGIVVAVLLLAAWWYVPGLGSEADVAPASSPAAAKAGVVHVTEPDVVGSDELALFQELIRAQESASAEALVEFPVRGVRGLPTAPIAGLDKASGKRLGMAEDLFGQAFKEIGRARGMTRRELEAIWRRGMAEGWRERLCGWDEE